MVGRIHDLRRTDWHGVRDIRRDAAGAAGALLLSAVFSFVQPFKVIERLAVLFTPVVTGVYLLLLVMQLSQPIVKGLLGIGYLKTASTALYSGSPWL